MKKTLAAFLTILMIFTTFATISAFAANSPSGKKTYKITISSNIGDEKSDFTYVQKGDQITIEANKKRIKEGYEFKKWKIDGDYEIISGSLESVKLVIKANSDLDIEQVFKLKKEDKPQQKKDKKEKKQDDSDVSPKTGDNTLPLVFAGIIFTAAAAAFVTKKVQDK